MILFFLFWLGASIGSFLNVCIWRLPRHESVAYPPSHCPTCNSQLKGADLWPLLSQLWLRGRCRYCKTPYSWRYFGVELLTGALFVLVGAQPGNLDGTGVFAPWIGDPARLARDLIFVSTLVVVFFVDYDTRYIQLESVFLMGLAGVAYDMYRYWQGGEQANQVLTANLLPNVALPAPLPACLVAMVATAGALWVVREASCRIYGKEALGLGDVLLVAAIAATLGWNATLITFYFLAVMLGATLGSLVQIPRVRRTYRWAKRRFGRYGGTDMSLALARHSFRKAIMPFGPMLAIGAVAALLYGVRLNEAYLNLYAQGPVASPAVNGRFIPDNSQPAPSFTAP